MPVKEKDVEKSNVILFIMLYLFVWYHHCLMLGTITALCRQACANLRDVDYFIIVNELF